MLRRLLFKLEFLHVLEALAEVLEGVGRRVSGADGAVHRDDMNMDTIKARQLVGGYCRDV